MVVDAEQLVVAWNARQEAHMPMLFSPMIGTAIATRHWYLRRPAWRTTNAVDLPTLDRRGDHQPYSHR
jgi:hypothetical protein